MNVIVALEQRFDRTPDGSVWTPGPFARSFWDRYLAVFDGVKVFARVREVDSPETGWRLANGPGVSLMAAPYYVGPQGYLLNASRIRRAARNAGRGSDAVILRACTPLGARLAASLVPSGYPYGVEVVGDPHDVFGPGAVKHPLRPLLRWWLARQVRLQCRRSCAVSYVTRNALQRRYPPAPGAYSTDYSSIELGDAAFCAAPRRVLHQPERLRIISVASLNYMVKGIDVLIEAVAMAARTGRYIEAVIVGDGAHRPQLEAQARRAGLGSSFRFAGQLPPGSAVREELDQADLFVLPARAEGLPRAIIEAMARGLPAIATSVGGIPELLSPEDLVPPGDASALAEKIIGIMNDPERLTAMSARNLSKASDYRDETLGERRKEFYSYLREKTQVWLDGNRR